MTVERIYFTDGACSGNPGRGGWAVVCPDGNVESGGCVKTTNNRMEMMALIRALEIAEAPCVIVSDSQYVVKGVNEWMEGWIKSGWKRGTLKNLDLWLKIRALLSPGIEIRWVRGHNGTSGNERADQAAVSAMNGRLAEDEGYQLCSQDLLL